MKKIFVVLMMVVFVGVAFVSFAQDSKTQNKVVAYYFYGSFRCYTCKKFEQYTREVIDADFKEAISSGKLEFKPVNIEDRGNEHYAQDYKLYTKSLILSLVKDGKEKEWKNLEKIWEYAGNKERFTLYVKDSIDVMLKEVK